VLCADPYASSGYASSGYASSEDTIENEPAVAAPAIKQGARAERRPSFTITNEHGERRGSLNDETAQGWGWQVSDAPLYPDKPLSRRDSGVLRQSGSESEDAEAPARTRRKARVRFATDKKVGFYGFIFSYEGATCIAHGADPSFAGLSLSAVLSRTNNREVDGDALHRRFIAAAEAGGGWVTYEWRNSSDAPLRLKGAYIIKLRASSMRTCYSGVGYSIMPPPARQPVATGYRVQGPPPARQPVDMGAHEAERMAGPVPCTARIAGPPINSPIHPEGLRRNTHVSAAPCVSPSRPAAKDRVQGTGYRGGVEVPGVPPSRAAAKAAAAADEASAAKALKDGAYTKALKIIMARSVGAQKIGDALAEALEPKVKGTDAPMGDFKAFFGGLDKLDTGNQITFTQVGTTLKVEVPSGAKDFSSAALCKAMFDIYLGDSPVSPNGKASMAQGLLKLCGK